MKRFGTNNRDPDRDLISRMVEGDAEAIRALYDRHSRQVYALLFRITGDRQTAEDVLQEVFLRSWRHADTYQESAGRVLPWLLAIAHNLALNELRRQRRRPQPALRRAGAEEDEHHQIPSVEPDPADQAWERIRQERVGRAMAELPEPQRVVIDLFATGHSQSEISDRLNEPLGTVKSRMRRGLHQLRDLLAAEGIGLE